MPTPAPSWTPPTAAPSSGREVVLPLLAKHHDAAGRLWALNAQFDDGDLAVTLYGLPVREPTGRKTWTYRQTWTGAVAYALLARYVAAAAGALGPYTVPIGVIRTALLHRLVPDAPTTPLRLVRGAGEAEPHEESRAND